MTDKEVVRVKIGLDFAVDVRRILPMDGQWHHLALTVSSWFLLKEDEMIKMGECALWADNKYKEDTRGAMDLIYNKIKDEHQ